MVDDSHALISSYERRGRERPGQTLACPRTLWALGVLAMVLDIALTGVGLSMGLTERNWLARLFIREFGLLGAGVLLKGFTLLLGYAGWRLLPILDAEAGRHRNLVLLAAALPSWAAVGVNAAAILVAS